jgi:hypothetical protein
MQNRTWTAIGLSPVFLPSRTRVKETCFEYKIQSCYAVNDLHGPAKNGVKSYMKSHSRSRNATRESYRYLIIKNGQNIEISKWPFEGRSRATKCCQMSWMVLLVSHKTIGGFTFLNYFSNFNIKIHMYERLFCAISWAHKRNMSLFLMPAFWWKFKTSNSRKITLDNS